MATLKLIMEKGPRKGETLTYASRSMINIGRVDKGNTITINDPGISANHIRIRFDKKLKIWNICDLGSSNGTVLNGETIKPDVLCCLEDGDCIKIGESTTVFVKIEDDSPIIIQPRRNPPRLQRGKKDVNLSTSSRVLRSSKEKEVILIPESFIVDEESKATCALEETKNESVEKESGVDNGQWKDLEKMTLTDFFDYLEVQLPKEIYDKSEKIISDLDETTRRYHEFRHQRNDSGKGK